MAVLVRSTALTLGPAAPGDDDRGRARVGARRRHPAGRAAGRAHAADRHGAAASNPRCWPRTSPSRCSSARSAAATRCTCAGCAASCAAGSPTRTAGWPRSCTTRSGRRRCPTRVRRPVLAVARVLAAGPRRRGRRGQHRGPCSGPCGRPPGWRGAGSGPASPAAPPDLGRSRPRLGRRAVRRRRPLHRPPARRHAGPVRRAPAAPSRSRATRTRPPRPPPRPSRSSPRTPARGWNGISVCVANVQEGVWPDLRRRGSLARHRTAGRRAARHRRQPAGLARPAAGRGTAAVLRRRHPRPAPPGRHRRRRRRGATLAAARRARPASTTCGP